VSALRDPLALKAFAAWINCDVEDIPEENKTHTCEATMIAWARVAAVFEQHYAGVIDDLRSDKP